MIQGTCHCGAVEWRFAGEPEGTTACNCTVCRRYGVLWAYDYEGEGIRVSGATRAYVRGEAIEFHFCRRCGCVAFWRARQLDERRRRRIAVNLRLAEPEAVAGIPIDHFDGLDTFEDLPRDGRCVADCWVLSEGAGVAARRRAEALCGGWKDLSLDHASLLGFDD